MTRESELLHFAWQRQGKVIVIYSLAAIGVLVLILVGLDSYEFVVNAWGKAGAVLGIATLGVALLVWWGELVEDWEESLPKRLSVVFYLVGPTPTTHRPLMICLDATLGGPSDIRAMAQQVGRQMTNQSLDLYPQFEVAPPRLDRQAMVRRYFVSILLRELPSKLETTPENHGIMVDLQTGRWHPEDVGDMRTTIDQLRTQNRL